MTPLHSTSRPRRAHGLDYVVLASAKSGTTWMQRLLCAHPEVHCSESRLFGRYFDKNNPSGPNLTVESYVENLARHLNPPSTPDSPADYYTSLLHNIIDAIARTARDASGKPIYGEKFTPYAGTGEHAVARLHGYNPDLRLIHLVRDGRDVIVSGAVHWYNLQLRDASGDRAAQIRSALADCRVLDQPLEIFTELWLDSVRAGLLAEARFDTLTIRYEDLLTTPIQTLQAVLAHIGADPAAAATCLNTASFENLSGGRVQGQEDRSSFFRRGVAGDWHTWLSPAQVEAFESRAREYFLKLGYEPASAVAAHG